MEAIELNIIPELGKETEGEARLGRFTRKDRGWMAIFFGTAIGSGILFLPVEASIGGIWVLIAAAVIGYPMVYLSQRLYLSVLADTEKNEDYTNAMQEYVGPKFSMVASFAFFAGMFLSLFSYIIGLSDDLG